MTLLAGKKIRVGAQPIIWSNDDFQELGGDIPLERCLREMREAGYAGTELGHKFPTRAKDLSEILKAHDLELISGWHSAALLSRSLDEEQAAFGAHLDLLKALGSEVAIVAECTGRTYPDPERSLRNGDLVETLDWGRLCRGLDALSSQAADRGLTLVYHHHMGTVVQNLSEIDRLMENTKEVSLLADTGHLAFAGIEPIKIFETYADRIRHVHLKDVRREVVERARREGLSFARSVKEGVFTVPGDGDIDYRPIFKAIAAAGYEGWLVVEAEQDPTRAVPAEYARKGREYIHQTAGI